MSDEPEDIDTSDVDEIDDPNDDLYFSNRLREKGFRAGEIVYQGKPLFTMTQLQASLFSTTFRHPVGIPIQLVDGVHEVVVTDLRTEVVGRPNSMHCREHLVWYGRGWLPETARSRNHGPDYVYFSIDGIEGVPTVVDAQRQPVVDDPNGIIERRSPNDDSTARR